MSSTPCYLFDGGNLYAVPNEHVAIRARWPFAVKEEDRARVLQQGARGVHFEDLRPTHCAVIVFDIGAARTATRDASLHTPVPQVHDERVPGARWRARLLRESERFWRVEERERGARREA